MKVRRRASARLWRVAARQDCSHYGAILCVSASTTAAVQPDLPHPESTSGSQVMHKLVEPTKALPYPLLPPIHRVCMLCKWWNHFVFMLCLLNSLKQLRNQSRDTVIIIRNQNFSPGAVIFSVSLSCLTCIRLCVRVCVLSTYVIHFLLLAL